MKIEQNMRSIQSPLEEALKNFKQDDILGRIFNHDHTVWADSPDEISNRLGWLTISKRILEELDTFTQRIDAILEKDFQHVVLLGMGGSSLAPDMFRQIFEPSIDFRVLDTTHPDEIRAIETQIDLSRTAFIVATKSGGTAETLSLFKYFFNLTAEIINDPGSHFIAITDPGSKLQRMAEELEFLEIFQNDPNIGGRFSVLSFFGMVPAALMGINIKELLNRANSLAEKLFQPPGEESNDIAVVGLGLGLLSNQRINKLTIRSSEQLKPFGDWLEQLIAESTGKHGKGILPVIQEQGFNTENPREDRIILSISMVDEPQPVNADISFQLEDMLDIGALMYAWEMITVLACFQLEINPFDQPDVELAKISARKAIEDFQREGSLPDLETSELSKSGLNSLMAGVKADYISLQAYAPYTAAAEALGNLQERLYQYYGRPVTIGFGPRFLHSTGQLHKGDQGKGVFIQLIQSINNDIDIPDEAGKSPSVMSFGTLIRAQALGDRQALNEKNRKVITIESEDIAKTIIGFLPGLEQK